MSRPSTRRAAGRAQPPAAAAPARGTAAPERRLHLCKPQREVRGRDRGAAADTAARALPACLHSRRVGCGGKQRAGGLCCDVSSHQGAGAHESSALCSSSGSKSCCNGGDGSQPGSEKSAPASNKAKPQSSVSTCSHITRTTAGLLASVYKGHTHRPCALGLLCLLAQPCSVAGRLAGDRAGLLLRRSFASLVAVVHETGGSQVGTRRTVAVQCTAMRRPRQARTKWTGAACLRPQRHVDRASKERAPSRDGRTRKMRVSYMRRSQ
jgi:hypothetical protein